VGQIIDAILGLGGAGAYVVIGLLAFGEAAAFVRLLLPGEVAALLGGVLASRGQVSLPLILLVAAVAAIAGDSVGCEIGRRWGSRLVDTRFLHRRADAVRYVRGHSVVVVGSRRVVRCDVPRAGPHRSDCRG
jgi:membrane protein DedA with SNARE-associated domain